ncbi:MAG: tetratricopeptide repeat protein [Bacteroidales bacterium]|nr:tetratricopeptide repeat protein [Bacteroidales bacterium]
MRKHNILYWIISVVFGLMTLQAHAQNDVRPLVRKGNELFKKGKFSDAEVEYRKALEKNPKYEKAQFNLGDAIYQEKNFKEADPLFSKLIKNSKNNALKANSLYNLGNTMMSQKNYESSINAYINSLRLNPNDYDAKYNLEYARKMLKKQDQNKNNKNNKDQNKKNQNKNQNKKNDDKNKKDNKNGKNNKDQNNNKNQNNKQNQNNQNQNGKNNPQNQPNQPPQMSKADAQRMLDALRNNEKNTLKNLEKKKAVKTEPNGIDW